jgi:hypothetical protein
MKDIFVNFPITETEFNQLENKFGNLGQYAAWQLIKKNSRNNHTEEQEDIAQELKLSLVRAGSYYKRQVYIESCLDLCEKYAKDNLLKSVVKELKSLWANKTRHGAGRQCFGPYQEMLLNQMVKRVVPKSERPSRAEPLQIDTPKFATYCKAIAWNAQKSMGKKITREKDFRCNQVSLSQFDYLGSN